jgi:hypothetical protein
MSTFYCTESLISQDCVLHGFYIQSLLCLPARPTYISCDDMQASKTFRRSLVKNKILYWLRRANSRAFLFETTRSQESLLAEHHRSVASFSIYPITPSPHYTITQQQQLCSHRLERPWVDGSHPPQPVQLRSPLNVRQNLHGLMVVSAKFHQRHAMELHLAVPVVTRYPYPLLGRWGKFVHEHPRPPCCYESGKIRTGFICYQPPS